MVLNARKSHTESGQSKEAWCKFQNSPVGIDSERWTSVLHAFNSRDGSALDQNYGMYIGSETHIVGPGQKFIRLRGNQL